MLILGNLKNIASLEADSVYFRTGETGCGRLLSKEETVKEPIFWEDDPRGDDDDEEEEGGGW